MFMFGEIRKLSDNNDIVNAFNYFITIKSASNCSFYSNT